jgi:hypothetical protein
MSTFIKWLIKAVIAPLLIDWVVTLYKKAKRIKENEAKVKENEQAAEAYDKHPDIDTFNKLP